MLLVGRTDDHLIEITFSTVAAYGSFLLAEHFGVDAPDLAGKHITDPWASVRADVALLKANPFLPSEFLVSGLVYDVETGLMEQVVGPELLRDETNAAA